MHYDAAAEMRRIIHRNINNRISTIRPTAEHTAAIPPHPTPRRVRAQLASQPGRGRACRLVGYRRRADELRDDLWQRSDQRREEVRHQ